VVTEVTRRDEANIVLCQHEIERLRAKVAELRAEVRRLRVLLKAASKASGRRQR
jgi:multidrug resistance efflux pump